MSRRDDAVRLTREAAHRLALEAAADSPFADRLMLHETRAEDGRLTWRFGTFNRGAGLEVAIDDATGAAHVTRLPGR